MNPEAQAYLEEILKKNPAELTEEECAFLRARVSYLKPAQKEEYEDVLKVKNQTSDKETVKKHGKPQATN